jgi:hypothetical protein
MQDVLSAASSYSLKQDVERLPYCALLIGMPGCRDVGGVPRIGEQELK